MAFLRSYTLGWATYHLVLRHAFSAFALPTSTEFGNPFNFQNGSLSGTMVLPESDEGIPSLMEELKDNNLRYALRSILSLTRGKECNVTIDLKQIKSANLVTKYNIKEQKFTNVTVEEINKTATSQTPLENLGNVTENLRRTLKLYERQMSHYDNATGRTTEFQLNKRATRVPNPEYERDLDGWRRVFDWFQDEWTVLVLSDILGYVFFGIYVLNEADPDFWMAADVLAGHFVGFTLTLSFLYVLAGLLSMTTETLERFRSPFWLALDLIQIALEGIVAIEREDPVRRWGHEIGMPFVRFVLAGRAGAVDDGDFTLSTAYGPRTTTLPARLGLGLWDV